MSSSVRDPLLSTFFVLPPSSTGVGVTLAAVSVKQRSQLGWFGGVVVRSGSSDSEVAGSSPTRTAIEYVIYTRGAQANSAFHPSGIDK